MVSPVLPHFSIFQTLLCSSWLFILSDKLWNSIYFLKPFRFCLEFHWTSTSIREELTSLKCSHFSFLIALHLPSSLLLFVTPNCTIVLTKSLNISWVLRLFSLSKKRSILPLFLPPGLFLGLASSIELDMYWKIIGGQPAWRASVWPLVNNHQLSFCKMSPTILELNLKTQGPV